MEKNAWLDFLSSKVRSQILLENSQKAQNWALALLALLALGAGLNAPAASGSEISAYAGKIQFLMGFQLVMALFFYLPNLLQKGQNPVARFFSLQEETSLAVLALGFAVYALVILNLSFKLISNHDLEASHFVNFAVWVQFFVALVYAIGLAIASLSYFSSPQGLIKFLGVESKLVIVGLVLHTVVFLMLGAAYGELVPANSPEFFDHLKFTAPVWLFMVVSLVLLGKVIRSSAVPALASLELEVVSGKIERSEAILARLKEAFVSRRFDFSLRNTAKSVSEKAHEIAKYTHDAISLVDRDKPSELDLRSVEERYKKAEAIYRKLEKDNLRFSATLTLLVLSDLEREKAEAVRDQFSRELRNAKLELASVRKRIDERLVSFKAVSRPAVVAPLAEEIPISH